MQTFWWWELIITGKCWYLRWLKIISLHHIAWAGLGNEQSPHYLNMAKTYIEANPGTPVGSPGRYQVWCETYCWSVWIFFSNAWCGFPSFLTFRGSTRGWLCTTWDECGRVWSMPPRFFFTASIYIYMPPRWTWQGCASSPTRSTSCQELSATKWELDLFLGKSVSGLVFRKLCLRIGWLFLAGKDQSSFIFFHAISMYRLMRW